MSEEKTIPEWAKECLHCKKCYECTLLPEGSTCVNFEEVEDAERREV